MDDSSQTCELCASAGGEILWNSALCRVVRVTDPHYPGFCRVIWTTHVKEMTDLDPIQRRTLMEVVFAVESVIRELFNPDKINLASFGNMVPHVHWHVIPRWRDDRHFPEPIWGGVHRQEASRRQEVDSLVLAHALAQALGPALRMEKS